MVHVEPFRVGRPGHRKRHVVAEARQFAQGQALGGLELNWWLIIGVRALDYGELPVGRNRTSSAGRDALASCPQSDSSARRRSSRECRVSGCMLRAGCGAFRPLSDCGPFGSRHASPTAPRQQSRIPLDRRFFPSSVDLNSQLSERGLPARTS